MIPEWLRRGLVALMLGLMYFLGYPIIPFNGEGFNNAKEDQTHNSTVEFRQKGF